MPFETSSPQALHALRRSRRTSAPARMTVALAAGLATFALLLASFDTTAARSATVATAAP